MKNKAWCKHIKWEDHRYIGWYHWVFRVAGKVKSEPIVVARNWKVCPVCQAERPTRENIAAAKLRALMDGDL